MAGLAFTLARLRFTGDVRFILANCSGVSGRASGSANAAARDFFISHRHNPFPICLIGREVVAAVPDDSGSSAFAHFD
jgi:hypothetical protein